MLKNPRKITKNPLCMLNIHHPDENNSACQMISFAKRTVSRAYPGYRIFETLAGLFPFFVTMLKQQF